MRPLWRPGIVTTGSKTLRRECDQITVRSHAPERVTYYWRLAMNSS